VDEGGVRGMRAMAQVASQAVTVVEVAPRMSKVGDAPPATPSGMAPGVSELPSLLRSLSVHSCHRENHEKTSQPAQCAVLDGRYVTLGQGSNAASVWRRAPGVPQGFLTLPQLLAACEWFRVEMPACSLRIFLCGGRREQWWASQQLSDFRDKLVWKPSGSDVDRFLVELVTEGIDDLAVVLVTNARFQRVLGMSLGDTMINAAWVDQHTLRFTFDSGTFRLGAPEWHPVHNGAADSEAGSGSTGRLRTVKDLPCWPWRRASGDKA